MVNKKVTKKQMQKKLDMSMDDLYAELGDVVVKPKRTTKKTPTKSVKKVNKKTTKKVVKPKVIPELKELEAIIKKKILVKEPSLEEPIFDNSDIPEKIEVEIVRLDTRYNRFKKLLKRLVSNLKLDSFVYNVKK